jgi:hypothetical protein
LLIEGGEERTGMNEEKEKERMSEDKEKGEGEEDQVDARFSFPPESAIRVV